MPSNPVLSVVLPSFLEEENLRLLLPRLRQVLADLNVPSEILIIDTHQPLDGTKNVCIENDCRYIPRSPSNDFGDAVRTGIQESTGKWTLFMDADGSHAPEFIPELFKYAQSYDLVIASRYVKGGFTENSKILILMSLVLNITYRWVLGLKCKDVSNSFKLYRTSLLKELKLTSRNFDIIEEILFKIHRNHRETTIHEVPFSFKKRMFGETKRNLFLFVLTYLFTMVRLRLSVNPLRGIFSPLKLEKPNNTPES